ncbi:DUF6011 domain-containing protein [Sporomusa sp.]|uniref:DUF6011 domain-containing protein n=1 Tax=Sporomusa sp. TaxID=2078658 RepID=UPI002CAD0BA5|nr:DUF6011 domain-containing protein [Sporomusa sp.]HWR06158.1 DUF6011 domain-containing protein [Sporomusa sp.]
MLNSTVEASQCERCGRKLRSKQAMEDGMGRVCKGKAAAERALKQAQVDKQAS